MITPDEARPWIEAACKEAEARGWTISPESERRRTCCPLGACTIVAGGERWSHPYGEQAARVIGIGHGPAIDLADGFDGSRAYAGSPWHDLGCEFHERYCGDGWLA